MRGSVGVKWGGGGEGRTGKNLIGFGGFVERERR